MATIGVPDYRERVLFIGANGTGKTTLARALLDHVPRYVVLDSKGDFPTRETDEIIADPTSRRVLRDPPDHLILRPDARRSGGRWLNYILRCCYERAQSEGRSQPFVVYVDEALYLSRTGHTHYLAALAVSGRSLGVGLWCSSQRSRWIPVEVKSEAWRWYIFYLGYEEDEKEVLRYAKGRLTLPDLQQSTEHHAFIEMRRDPARAGAMAVRRFPPVAA